MGCCSPEFVLNKRPGPSAHEIGPNSADHTALSGSGAQPETLKIIKASHTVVGRTSRHYPNQIVLQGLTAGHDDTHADRAFTVEPLEILQVAIKERVFVIPFDFQGDGAFIGSPHMVDFMRDRGPLYVIDGLP